MSANVTRPIIITGFMCAGKTTVARALALRLHSEMIDLDDRIVEQERRTIADLINKEGEARFRQLETVALRSVLENSRARIIALGGGAWTVERNRGLIAEHDGITIWLDAPFELCWSRIMNEQQLRPLALDYRSTHKLYTGRLSDYEMATLRVEATQDKSADNLALEIIKALLSKRFINRSRQFEQETSKRESSSND